MIKWLIFCLDCLIKLEVLTMFSKAKEHKLSEIAHLPFNEIGQFSPAQTGLDDAKAIEGRKREIAKCEAEKLNIEAELRVLQITKQKLRSRILFVHYHSGNRDIAEETMDDFSEKLESVQKKIDELNARKSEIAKQKNILTHNADPELQNMLNEIFNSFTVLFKYQFKCARNIINNRSIITIETPSPTKSEHPNVHANRVYQMFESFRHFKTDDYAFMQSPAAGAVRDEVHNSIKIIFNCDRTKVVTGLRAIAQLNPTTKLRA